MGIVPAIERPHMYNVLFDSVQKTFGKAAFPFLRRPAEKHALRNMSLEVARGEVLALLGPNGSGKSTALKLIATILLPDQGTVWVNGLDTRNHEHEVRRQVGFALASERSFFPRLTIRENLDFFATLEDVPRSERPRRIDQAIEEVEMEEHANKQVMKLSSGMLQRLAIARALIKRPRVLLLDEATRSLDPAAAWRFWELIRTLASAEASAVLATHSFDEAVAAADRVVILRKGELLGTRRVAGLSAEQLRDYYCDVTGEKIAPAWAGEVPA